MIDDDDDYPLIGYAPVPLPPWVCERALLLKQYLFERGVRRSHLGASEIDEAILLLAGELLLPEMPFAIVRSLPAEELVLVHVEADMGPKPAKSESRLVRALGLAPPNGILSARSGLPWILTSFQGASRAADMGYITIPVAELKQVVGASVN